MLGHKVSDDMLCTSINNINEMSVNNLVSGRKPALHVGSELVCHCVNTQPSKSGDMCMQHASVALHTSCETDVFEFSLFYCFIILVFVFSIEWNKANTEKLIQLYEKKL